MWLQIERPMPHWMCTQAWLKATCGCAMCLQCMGRRGRVWARVNDAESRGYHDCHGCREGEARFVVGCSN